VIRHFYFLSFKTNIMKKLVIIAFAISFLAACQKEVITDRAGTNEKPAVQENKEKDKPKTFEVSGTVEGTTMIVPSQSCNYGFITVGEGKGVSSHFGSFSFSNADCLGTMHHTVFSYPNGDKAYTTQVSETVNPLTGLPVQDAVFAGGTGRFEGSTGSTRLYITKFEPTASPGVYNVAGRFVGTVTIVK
jgi:hypothetical protein